MTKPEIRIKPETRTPKPEPEPEPGALDPEPQSAIGWRRLLRSRGGDGDQRGDASAILGVLHVDGRDLYIGVRVVPLFGVGDGFLVGAFVGAGPRDRRARQRLGRCADGAADVDAAVDRQLL